MLLHVGDAPPAEAVSLVAHRQNANGGDVAFHAAHSIGQQMGYSPRLLARAGGFHVAYNSDARSVASEGRDMPKTPYTAYCNHVYQLTQDVRKFIEEAMLPAIDARCANNPEARPRQYRVILYPFTRIVRWLVTFERLNSTNDMQAIGTGARCIFEHYLDLKWLQRFREEKWFDCFREFPVVDRYLAAKKVVEHKRANPTSTIDVTPHQAFMDAMDNREPLRARVLRVWGADTKGNPCWPRGHWTGEGNLQERAKKIGLECEDAYVQIYPTLCALVHPGPTPEHGDFAWLEKQVASGYFIAYSYAREAIGTVHELLQLDGHVRDYDRGMQQLIQWQREAMSKLGVKQGP